MSLASQVAALATRVATEVKGKASRVKGGDEAVAAASATTGSITLDASTASVFTLTPTGNITALAISNYPASSHACTITLIVEQGGTVRTIAAPTATTVKWLGAQPTQVANKACVFTYLTVDGGSTWYCSGVVQS